MATRDDGYTNRAATAVVSALLGARQASDTGQENLDLDAAMNALCKAEYLIAATNLQSDHGREHTAKLVEKFEYHISVELMTIADKVRAGALWSRPRPTLRMVP